MTNGIRPTTTVLDQPSTNGKGLVLVVDGDAAERRGLVEALGEARYGVVEAADGAAGLRQFFGTHPDMVVLGLDVAGVPGWELVERIRALASTPIVVLAPEPSIEALQKGFDLQVDGFLARPVDIEAFIDRLDAVRERRPDGNGKRGWIYRQNGLTINWRSCEVYSEGELVPLTGTEFKLLTYLAQRRGWVLSHDQILTEVWGPEYVGEKDRVKLYVWYLRQKIERDPSHPKLILTKRGLGYSFAG